MFCFLLCDCRDIIQTPNVHYFSIQLDMVPCAVTMSSGFCSPVRLSRRGVGCGGVVIVCVGGVGRGMGCGGVVCVCGREGRKGGCGEVGREVRLPLATHSLLLAFPIFSRPVLQGSQLSFLENGVDTISPVVKPTSICQSASPSSPPPHYLREYLSVPNLRPSTRWWAVPSFQLIGSELRELAQGLGLDCAPSELPERMPGVQSHNCQRSGTRAVEKHLIEEQGGRTQACRSLHHLTMMCLNAQGVFGPVK